MLGERSRMMRSALPFYGMPVIDKNNFKQGSRGTFAKSDHSGCNCSRSDNVRLIMQSEDRSAKITHAQARAGVNGQAQNCRLRKNP